MANVKISDLPAATSVDPFDTFVMVQSGVTKQASQANILTTTGNVTAAKFFPTGTSATGTGMYSAAANTLAWSNNGAETMRLDASGNLGLGVTPSGSYKLEVNGGGLLTGLNVSTGGANNTANTATFDTNGAGVARFYSRGANASTVGSYQWRLQSSNGSVDTQAMTLDASGNLGVGTSAPYAISTQGKNITVYNDTSIGNVSDNATLYAQSVNRNAVLALDGNATSQSSVTFITGGSVFSQVVGDAANSALLFRTGGTNERMRLDSSGNLGIGTSSPATKLNVYGGASGVDTRITVSNAATAIQIGIDSSNNAVIATNTANAISFFTNNTQAMTLTSGGDLLVGDTTQPTSADNRLAVIGTRGIDCKNTGGATAPNITAWNNATTGDNIFVSFRTETTDTARGSISYNRAGGLVAYNTTSDYRAKDIIGPVANPGATIDALKVYEGQMKGATQPRPMLVAHEAQTVAPYSVTGEKDAVNEDGTPKYQQMDVSSLVPLLIAEIQSLRARVAALEA